MGKSKTHVLRSRLVMDYTTSYFPLIVLGYPLDTLCPGACVFPPLGVTWSFWTNHRPRSYLRVYMGCASAIVFQVRSLYVPSRTVHSSAFRVRFGESLVFRLYSEIDHIHLSSEAQCDSHQLPPGGLPQETKHPQVSSPWGIWWLLHPCGLSQLSHVQSRIFMLQHSPES